MTHCSGDYVDLLLEGTYPPGTYLLFRTYLQLEIYNCTEYIPPI